MNFLFTRAATQRLLVRVALVVILIALWHSMVDEVLIANEREPTITELLRQYEESLTCYRQFKGEWKSVCSREIHQGTNWRDTDVAGKTVRGFRGKQSGQCHGSWDSRGSVQSREARPNKRSLPQGSAANTTIISLPPESSFRTTVIRPLQGCLGYPISPLRG